jgi:hypothetical protein
MGRFAGLKLAPYKLHCIFGMHDAFSPSRPKKHDFLTLEQASSTSSTFTSWRAPRKLSQFEVESVD